MSDALTIRLAVGCLGLALLVTVGGGVALSLYDKQVPDVLIGLGSAAAGALSGLLPGMRLGDPDKSGR